MEFKDRLREARRAKGYTQRELAEKIKSNANTISNWEKGVSRPTTPVIEALATALRITPFDLLGDYTVREVQAMFLKSAGERTPDEAMAVAFAGPLFHDTDIRIDEESRFGDISINMMYEELGDFGWEYRLECGGRELLFALDYLNDSGKALLFEVLTTILSTPAYQKNEDEKVVIGRRVWEFRNLISGLRRD